MNNNYRKHRSRYLLVRPRPPSARYRARLCLIFIPPLERRVELWRTRKEEEKNGLCYGQFRSRRNVIYWMCQFYPLKRRRRRRRAHTRACAQQGSKKGVTTCARSSAVAALCQRLLDIRASERARRALLQPEGLIASRLYLSSIASFKMYYLITFEAGADPPSLT